MHVSDLPSPEAFKHKTLIIARDMAERARVELDDLRGPLGR